MDTYQKSLNDHAAAILVRRKYEVDPVLLNELTDSFEHDNKSILRKVRKYKVLGAFLLVAIPVTSTLIAFSINIKAEQQPQPWLGGLAAMIPALSLMLAVLTTLNSIFKPSKRFSAACCIGLQLFHWRCTFLEGLELLEIKDAADFVGYLREHREALRGIQESQIALALPEQH